MREQVENANKAAKQAAEEAKALKDQLDSIEREKMTEQEKLRADLAIAQERTKELDQLRDENGKFASKLEKLYTDALQDVPEDKRSHVESLSASGTWADRLEALNAAKALITHPGVSVPRIQPTSPSVVTDPQVTPPSKTNLDVAKSGGVFGIPDITTVQFRKGTAIPQAND